MAKKKKKESGNPLYYYTFAYVVYPKADAEKPEKEQDRATAIVDMVLRGDDPEMLNKTVAYIAQKANERGYLIAQSPNITYTKRTKREILAIHERSKKDIFRNEKAERLEKERALREVMRKDVKDAELSIGKVLSPEDQKVLDDARAAFPVPSDNPPEDAFDVHMKPEAIPAEEPVCQIIRK